MCICKKMKYVQLSVGVLCFGITVLSVTEDNFERIKVNSIRIKRQEEPWSWGYVTVTDSDTNNAKARISESSNNDTTENKENPCDRKDPTMPDFRAPGRRISEIKCYEYIWQIKYREVKKQNAKECTKYLEKIKKYLVSVLLLGGRSALPGEFPHMGGIGWKAIQGKWIFKCGCSLISPKFVLTAAHCSKASPLDTTIDDIVPKIVRLGDKNIIDYFYKGLPPKDANILRIIVHPLYSPPRKYFDIALMELESEVVFESNVQPACLWGSFDTSSLGTEATLTGWGVVDTAGRTTSPDLQAAVVDIIDSERCDALLRPSCNRHWCGIEDHQICAGRLAGGVDACQGDSGGPLQVKIPLPTSTEGAMHYIIGVTSFGFGCALENTPGVYTRVSSFIDWIEANVWQ